MRKILFLCLCAVLLIVSSLLAQFGTGTLSGKVTDGKGNAVPNASVTVTNASNNSSVKVLSRADGTFTVSPVTAGTYTIEVESPGFKRAREENVVLATAGPATVNVTLTTGNPTDVVDLTATSPAVQSDNGERDAVLNEAQVKELPVIDRNHQELIGLQSGITPPATALRVAEDPDRNRYFSTNGQSPLANLHTLDGVNNQEYFRGNAIRVQPEESIHDMHISTANYLEDKGFAGGAVVNTTTRAGTNQLHGSLFEFNSNDDLRSRNFFNSGNIAPHRLVYNQFGATVGAPIVKNSTYFFASYEGMYRRGTEPVLTTVPTPALIGGNFSGVAGLTLFSPSSGTATGTNRSAFTGNIIPSSQINPTAAGIARFFPAPNLPGFTSNFATNVPLQNDAQRLDGRIDQHFSGSTMMFLRYGYTNARGLEGSPFGEVIGAGTRGRSVGQNAMLDFTKIFGPALTADLRFGYNRYTDRIRMSADQTALGTALGVSNFNNQLFGINIAGLATIGTPASTPTDGVNNTFNWVAAAGYRKSMHDLKFGVDIRRIRTDGFASPMFGTAGTAFFGPGTTMLNNGVSPTATSDFFNSFASFLLGAPSQFGVSSFAVPPSVRQTQAGIWAGDHLNLMSRLSVDFGVRYEVYSALVPGRSGGAAFFNPANNTFDFAGVGGTSMRAYDTDFDAIAPRFAFAFRATDKTVVRGGYGISYFQPAYIMSGVMAPITGGIAGVQGGFVAANLGTTFGPSLTSRFNPGNANLTGGVSAGNLPVSFIGRMDTPYVQSFSFEVQQELGAAFLLSGAYVGTLGRHLPYHTEVNAGAAGTGVAGLPFASFGRTASTQFFDNGMNNNYNSLQVNLTRRFSHGLSFLGSYTWSRALGYTAADGTLLFANNLRVNYGPLDYDRQHVLSISHMWELPFGRHGNNWVSTLIGGWQWNGVLTWQTGTPLTVTADPVLCNCPNATVLASLNGSQNPFLNNGPFFFNLGAFSAPAGATFGNLGRGALRGPDSTNYNVSLFKHFRFRDRFDLELRGEAYNVTNTAHFANPITNFLSPDFGRALMTSEVNGNRQLNVGFRAVF